MKSLLATILCGFCLQVAGLAANAAERVKPNIVIILVDDMGFSDIGCYGSEISTPNLDALAANGVRFTQFYNTGRCCPTRASLLTGLYSHQVGMGAMTSDSGIDGYRGDLNKQCVTIPEVLRTAGYSTYATGKWHVTKYAKADTQPEQKFNWPLQRGFDHYFGFIAGAANYFHPETLALDNTPLPVPGANFYTTDAFADHAIKFINDNPTNKPFFLYLAFNAPHFPLQAPARDIAKYRGKYRIGWDKLREQRHAKQISLGIVEPAWALSPRPNVVKAWERLTPAEQDRFDEIMAIYAACVDHMDQAVGRLVSDLRQRGVLENTLILFMSDNGGNAESGPDGKLLGKPFGGENSRVYCGESWATLENTPFRRYKHYNHEGGIATPLIVHWPAGIAAKGELRTQPGHLIDIMTTCVDVADAKYPAAFKGQAILPMEGRSLLPAFANQPIERDAIFWEHFGNAAVRVGDWKLVRVGREGAWELYNLKTDRTELHDLAAQEPARAKELAAKWEAWAVRAHVKPYPTESRGRGATAPKKARKEATKSHGETLQENGAPDDTALVSAPAGKKYVYKQSGGKPQEMEIYFPPGSDAKNSKVPGVILFHGGSWRGGNLDQFRYACKYLAGRGLVAATANYRMLTKDEVKLLPHGESNKRVCITDAKSAIRWMKHHASELGIDPQRLIAGGGSAGGHVALLATTNPGLNDPGDPKEADSSVAAYLLFNPALRPDSKPDTEVDALQHLKTDLPPAIFFFGDQDRQWKPAADLVLQKLKAMGNTRAELWIAQGKGHGFFNRPPWQDVTLAQADRFLVAHGFLTGPGTLTPPQSGEKLTQSP